MTDVNCDTRLQASINPVAQETMITRRGRTLTNGSPLLRSHKAPPRAARSNVRRAWQTSFPKFGPAARISARPISSAPQVFSARRRLRGFGRRAPRRDRLLRLNGRVRAAAHAVEPHPAALRRKDLPESHRQQRVGAQLRRLDAVVNYERGRSRFQVNVDKVLDRNYISAVRSNQLMVPGSPTNMRVSITRMF